MQKTAINALGFIAIVFASPAAHAMTSVADAVRENGPIPATRVAQMATGDVDRTGGAGWRPSPEDRREAARIAMAYLHDLDHARYEEAYALQAEALDRQAPLASFVAQARQFNETVGPVKERKVVKITWSKDPETASMPGIYASVDVVGRFANAERECGYVVLYRETETAKLTVLRNQATFITNASAREIAASRSSDALDRIWGQASRACPNYPGRS